MLSLGKLGEEDTSLPCTSFFSTSCDSIIVSKTNKLLKQASQVLHIENFNSYFLVIFVLTL